MSANRYFWYVCLWIVACITIQSQEATDDSSQKKIQSEKKDEKTQTTRKKDGSKNLDAKDDKSNLKTEELPETVVKEKQPVKPREYKVEKTTMGMKTDTPILEIPHTVNVITRDLMEDQAAGSVEDIWRNTAGVHTGFGDGAGGNISMRGFSSGGNVFAYPVLYNGLRGQPCGGWNSLKLYNLERVEILKGPAGVLYGSGSPSGVVNFVSRRPQDEYYHELDLTVGSFSLIRPHAHSTGPIDEQKRFLYMVDIGYENADSFRNNVEKENLQFTSSFAWIIGNNTRLDFEFGFIKDDRDGQPDRGVPFINGKAFVLSNKFTSNEPSDFSNLMAYYWELHFHHKFTDSLSLNSGVRIFLSDREYQNHIQMGIKITGTTLARRYFEAEVDEWGISTDTNLAYEIGNDQIKNKLLVGFDTFYDYQKLKNKSATKGVPGIDIYHPVYGLADPDTYTYAPTTETELGMLRYGVYIQDQLQLWQRLHIMGGVRYDGYDTDQIVTPGTTPDYLDNGGSFTFKGGLLYKVLDNLSVYVSSGQSYEPQSAPRVAQTRTFDPLMGWQVEGGIKSSWFDDKLSASIAGYYIIQENILVTDPVDTTLLIQIGEQESHGMEVEISGHITDYWSISANYAYTNARIKDDSNEKIVGQKLQQSATHQAGVWTRYKLWETGFSVFGGMTYVGDRLAWSAGAFDPNNPCTLPSYVSVDLGASYTYKYLTASFNIKNLLNEDIALGGRSDGYMPGEPLNFTLSLRGKF